MTEATMTWRAINRALLARQLLLERSPMPAQAAIEHLVGIQAQLPNSPYPGLWSRLEGFSFSHLSTLVTDRLAVRIAMMRSTVHLVTTADALRLRPVLQPMLERRFLSTSFAKALSGADIGTIVDAARQTLDERPLTLAELAKVLAARFPDRDPTALAQAARTYLPLVQIPPRGLWRHSGAARHTTLSTWARHLGGTGQPATLAELVTRYLGAFGPATVADIQTWSGLTRVREAIRSMDLIAVRSEDGTELWDLPEAPRPEPGTPAPTRFLSDYDNILLAHADRRRIVGPLDVGPLFRTYRRIPGTVLVDGYVRAVWDLEHAGESTTLRVQPIVDSVAGPAADAVVAEGERLLQAMGYQGHVELAGR